jgi:iron-sulfur cluster repair protein YtfE (RIC family)
MSTPLDSISEHHNQMQEDLEELIASVREHGSDGPLEELSSFLRDEIVPHATGEENHLYPEADELVREHVTPTTTMSLDHEWIESTIDEISERLRSIGENGREVPRELLDRLVELNAILALHLHKEEEAFFPLLRDHLSREEQQAIIDGLHDEYEDDPELDVRSLAPPERHPVITEEVDQLEPGKALVLVNDHDPEAAVLRTAVAPGRHLHVGLPAGRAAGMAGPHRKNSGAGRGGT